MDGRGYRQAAVIKRLHAGQVGLELGPGVVAFLPDRFRLREKRSVVWSDRRRTGESRPEGDQLSW